MKQSPNETVDSFLKSLRLTAFECQYSNVDEQILDALIFGINSPKTQSRLLQQSKELTLDMTLDIVRTEEATELQLAEISGKSNVHAIRRHMPPKPSTKPIKPCPNCGREHQRPKSQSDCPAFGSTCSKCGKKNHWAIVCRSSAQPDKRKNPTKQPRKQKVHTLQADANDTSDEAQGENSLYFHSVNHIINAYSLREEPLVNLEIASDQSQCIEQCKVDTGADGNILPYKRLKTVFPQGVDLTPSPITIEAYGGHIVKHHGKCSLTVKYKNQTHTDTFHVTDTDGPVILGLPTCKALDLITINYTHDIKTETAEREHSVEQNDIGVEDKAARAQIMTDYKDCFEGIGCFKGEFHVTVDPNVPPVIHPPRRIPVALQDALKHELETLVKQNIITKVDTPTNWVNSIVCVSKPNGSLRLCLDPKDLNAAIKRPHYVTATLDDVLPKLKGARFFTILDARSGYWNIKLGAKSSYLTTFATPYGRYRFLRLPFGLNCAQDVFQRKVDETFGDIPEVTGIADDIVVVGYQEDGKDHDANLKAVLQRARETGIKLNPDKLKVKCKKIPFFGNIIGASGLEPDPFKLDTINKMTAPKDVKELQTFLGLATYLQRFTPHLSKLAAPLRDLCKKDTIFSWEKGHQEAFENLKRELLSPKVLQYFDKDKPITIQVDASQKGLGAALLQDHGAIEYASKTLSDTESRYSNIEREMLAVLFGLERFHYYAFGRPVTVESDHKPLESIFKKHLNKASPRLSRMLLRIQKYNVTIKYIPGKEITLADALSRVNPCAGDEIKGLQITVHEIHAALNASPMRIKAIKEATAEDLLLQQIAGIITKGWPEHRTLCPKELLPFWNYRDELYIEDGILLKGERIIIPEILKEEALKQLHCAHQGAEKCKLRARGSVFWVNINKDIDEMVKACTVCQTYRYSHTKEPLIPHDIPKRPWHKLGTDLFHFSNNTYLLLADYGSKFPILRKLNSTTSAGVIEHMKMIFSEHGIPEILMSDNGPQFSSSEFRDFAAKYGFDHVTSSPMYPQSNGFIERTVQTVKNTMKKCLESRTDLHMALLCLRATPITSDIPAPCMSLNNRMYKTNIPTASRAVNYWNPDNLQKRLDTQKDYHDKGARELVPLIPDQPIRIQDPVDKTWSPGKVVRAADAPRSFNVEDTQSGVVYRRNRRHLHPVPNPGSSTEKTSDPPSDTSSTPLLGTNTPSLSDTSTPSPSDTSTPPIR